jgi:hypothetical protein
VTAAGPRPYAGSVPSRRELKRSAPFSALVRRGRAIQAAAALPTLSACLYLPSPVEGIPSGTGWLALPLRPWIAEGPVRAEAVAACLGDDCAHEVAVGAFAAGGAEADALAAVIRDPARLKRGLEANDAADDDRRRRPVRTLVEVAPLAEDGLDGFRISLARADGARPPAYGAVLARREGDRLRFVVAVGPSAEGARATALSVARAELGAR